MASSLGRALAALERLIRMQISRFTLTLINDAAKMQQLQITMHAGEPTDGVEHFQPYGLTAKPFAGAEGIFLRAGGSLEEGIAILVADRRYQLHGLADGEIALHDDQGQYVKIGRSEVRLKATTKVVIEGDLEVTGNATVTGDISDASGTAQTMADMRTTFNTHTHSATGVTPGGATLPIPPPNSPPM
jgi:phage gp45-like